MDKCKVQKLRKKKIQGWKQKVQIVLREKIAWGEKSKCEGREEKNTRGNERRKIQEENKRLRLKNRSCKLC